MLFNSTIFLFVFLPVTYAGFWSLRSKNTRYAWLTASGYVFYGYWKPAYCWLMAFSTLVRYLAGIGFLRWVKISAYGSGSLWCPSPLTCACWVTSNTRISASG